MVVADIMSRIILQAQGGDQVAREVGKVTKAYKDAGQASKGMSATGAGGAPSDPFTRATAPGGFIPSEQFGRAEQNRQYNENVQQREGHHNRLASMNQRVVRGIGAAGTVGSGDVMGGTSQGLGMLAGVGIAGLVTGAVAAIGMGVQRLSTKETERQEQLGRGLMQSIAPGGEDAWGTFRGQVNQLRLGGFPAEMLLPYLQGLKAQGAAFDPVNAANIGSMMWAEGIEPANMAQWQAVRQRAGTGALFSGRAETDLMRGEAAFGQAGLNRFVTAISGSIEQAMTRGIERGSEALQDQGVYTNFTRLLSALSLPGVGNLTDVGAIQAFNQIQQAVAASTQMARPIDAFQFMAMREPGESYGDTMRRMETPGSELDFFKNLEAQAGGREEILEILVREQFGVSWQAVQPTIRAFRNQWDYLQGDYTQYVPGTSRAAVDEELLRSARADAAAEQLVEGGQRTSRGIRNWVVEQATAIKQMTTPDAMSALYGAPTGLTIQAPAEYSRFERMWSRANRTGNLNEAAMTLPASMRDMASILQGTALGEELIPQMLLFGQYRAGAHGFTDREKAQMEVLTPVFEEMTRLLSIESIQQLLSDPKVQETVLSNANIINERETHDSLLEIKTIVEQLDAIITTLGLNSISDIEATE